MECIAFDDLGLHSMIVREKQLLPVDVHNKFGKIARKLLLRLRKDASDQIHISLDEKFFIGDAEENQCNIGYQLRVARFLYRKRRQEKNCPWYCAREGKRHLIISMLDGE
jgi:hypothetical protein